MNVPLDIANGRDVQPTVVLPPSHVQGNGEQKLPPASASQSFMMGESDDDTQEVTSLRLLRRVHSSNLSSLLPSMSSLSPQATVDDISRTLTAELSENPRVCDTLQRYQWSIRELIQYLITHAHPPQLFSQDAGGRYEFLVEEIGRGAFAKVRLELKEDYPQPLVRKQLKTMDTEDKHYRDALRRFVEEIDIQRELGELAGEYVAQVGESGFVDRSQRIHFMHSDEEIPEEGFPYMLMEHHPGVSLEQLIKAANGRSFPKEYAARLLRKICEAYAKIHNVYGSGEGVVHRDAKPGNLIVTDDGGVKIIDFGLARRIRMVETDPRTRTVSGVTFGTPQYLADEGLHGKTKNVDQAADMQAVGMMAYELLTGSRFYSEQDLNTRLSIDPDDQEHVHLLRRLQKRAAAKLDELAARDPEMAAVSRGLLDSDPAKRSTAILAVAQLNTIIEKANVPYGDFMERPKEARSIPLTLPLQTADRYPYPSAFGENLSVAAEQMFAAIERQYGGGEQLVRRRPERKTATRNAVIALTAAVAVCIGGVIIKLRPGAKDDNDGPVNGAVAAASGSNDIRSTPPVEIERTEKRPLEFSFNDEGEIETQVLNPDSPNPIVKSSNERMTFRANGKPIGAMEFFTVAQIMQWTRTQRTDALPLRLRKVGTQFIVQNSKNAEGTRFPFVSNFDNMVYFLVRGEDNVVIFGRRGVCEKSGNAVIYSDGSGNVVSFSGAFTAGGGEKEFFSNPEVQSVIDGIEPDSIDEFEGDFSETGVKLPVGFLEMVKKKNPHDYPWLTLIKTEIMALKKGVEQARESLGKAASEENVTAER